MKPPSNREAAKEFLQMVATGAVRKAYRKYIGPDFLHHNPFFRGDAASLATAMEEAASANPDTTLEVKRVLEDKDLVAVHSWIKQQPGDRGFAVVHILRFKNHRVVEAWDVVQQVPEDSPNEHGMF